MNLYNSEDGKYTLVWRMGGMPNQPRGDGRPAAINLSQHIETNNCGMGCLTGGSMRWHDAQGHAWDYHVRAKNAPTDLPALTDEKVWACFLEAVPKMAATMDRGIYALSNGVNYNDMSYMSGEGYYRVLDTHRFNLWFMRAIRELKCGTLITTPIVENPSHADSGCIIAAFWIPPHSCKRIFHGKVGISIGHTDKDIETAKNHSPAVAEGVAGFVENFYGRTPVAKRIKNSDGAGKSTGIDAAAG